MKSKSASILVILVLFLLVANGCSPQASKPVSASKPEEVPAWVSGKPGKLNL